MSSPLLTPTRAYTPGPGYEQNVLSLLLNRGDIAGRAALMSGQAWANAVQNIGGIAAGAAQQIHEQNQQRQVGQAVSGLLTKASMDPDFDLGGELQKMGVDPKLYEPVIKGFSAAHEEGMKVKEQWQTLQQQQMAFHQKMTDAGYRIFANASRPELEGDDGGLSAMEHGLLTSSQYFPRDVIAHYAQPIIQARKAFDAAQQSGDPQAIAAATQQNKALRDQITNSLQMQATPEAVKAVNDEIYGELKEMKPGTGLIRTRPGQAPTVVMPAAGGERTPATFADASGKAIEGSMDKVTGKYYDAAGNEVPNPQRAAAPRDPLSVALAQANLLNAQAQQSKFRDERMDKSFQYNNTQLQNLLKPIVDQAARLDRLETTLAQNTRQADALVAPELLSVMAGGQGSGLRMNEAEISRIVGGRTVWENLKSKVSAYSTNPSEPSLTTAQRAQIQSLIGEVRKRSADRLAMINDANASLLGATSPDEHRRIIGDVRQQLAAADQPKAAPKRYKFNPATGMLE